MDETCWYLNHDVVFGLLPEENDDIEIEYLLDENLKDEDGKDKLDEEDVKKTKKSWI